ncbi:hypothetical protein [Streptomyces lasalocidi]|uniref:Uncharacterized protein n=1 Tax=Streptomyces lasalocidi TaxID=324833 RepID=A0A4U5WML7_STRLS|nr:hypothetical protein [Streptomyces lasalocidi]TKT03435.1 hypothetical protein E4U91_27310 [Streptomyces lasalocidi]
MTLAIRIEYPNDRAIDASGDTLEELIEAVNVAIATLWGKRKYGDNAVTLEEIEQWLNQAKQAE